MRHVRFVLLLLVCLVLVACSRPPADNAGRKARIKELYAGYLKDFPTAPDISPEAAVALWREDKLLPIDVRTPEERSVSILPGAVTEEDYLADPTRYGDRQAVAYCTIGYRSGMFTAKARERNLPVRNLAGGLLGWLHAGGTMVDPTGRPTKTVHVYGATWNLAPLGYKTVW